VSDVDLETITSIKLMAPDGASSVHLSVQSASVRRNGKFDEIRYVCFFLVEQAGVFHCI
jgi:hypothetical protein